MEKFRATFACDIIAVLLCACTSRSYISTSTKMQTEGSHAQPDETQVQTVEIQPMEMPTQSAEGQPQQEEQSTYPSNQENDMQLPRGADNLEAAQAELAEVISGKGRFFSHSYGINQTLDEYLSTFAAEPDASVGITKYTTVDLDQDNVPEIVLGITENEQFDYGFLVLRYENGSVVGYDFTYRQMINLKEEGTFGYSGGVADTGYARLIFTDGGWKYKNICNITEDGDTVAFFCNGEKVPEEVYWQLAEEQDTEEKTYCAEQRLFQSGTDAQRSLYTFFPA